MQRRSRALGADDRTTLSSYRRRAVRASSSPETFCGCGAGTYNVATVMILCDIAQQCRGNGAVKQLTMYVKTRPTAAGLSMGPARTSSDRQTTVAGVQNLVVKPAARYTETDRGRVFRTMSYSHRGVCSRSFFFV